MTERKLPGVRIGGVALRNLFRHVDGHLFKVSSIDAGRINGYKPGTAQGIELTYRLIQDMGWCGVDTDGWDMFVDCGGVERRLFLERDENYREVGLLPLRLYLDDTFLREVSYVHDIQNVYYMLTGQELTVDLSSEL